MRRLLACAALLLPLLCGEEAGAVSLTSPVVLPAPLPVSPNNPAYPYVQAFTNCIPDLSVLAGNASFVWGAGGGGAWQNPPVGTCTPTAPTLPYGDPVPGVPTSMLWPGIWNQINAQGNGHDLTWFQANHPDWILYACDQQTPAYLGLRGLPAVLTSGSRVVTVQSGVTPGYLIVGAAVFGANIPAGATISAINPLPASATIEITMSAAATASAASQLVYFLASDSTTRFVPLNFQSAAVIAFIQDFILARKNAGNKGQGFDVSNPTNTSSACGFYQGAQAGIGSPPAYGGAWTQLFSGIGVDQDFMMKRVRYAQTMTAYAHTLGMWTVGNVFEVGFSSDNNRLDYVAYGGERQQNAAFDIGLWESSFWHCKALPLPCRWLTDTALQAAVSMFQTQGRISPQWLINYPACSVGWPNCYGVATVTPVAGGSGYAVNDRVLLSSGVYVQVSTIGGGGAITAALPLTGSQTNPAGTLTQTSVVNGDGGASSGSGFTAQLTYRDDQAETVAEFLLLRAGGSYPPTYWTPRGMNWDSAKFQLPHLAWRPQVGVEVPPPGGTSSDAYFDPAGCLVRYYSQGLAALNPSPTTTCSVTVLSAGHDVHGNAIGAGPITLQPRGGTGFQQSIVVGP